MHGAESGRGSGEIAYVEHSKIIQQSTASRLCSVIRKPGTLWEMCDCTQLSVARRIGSSTPS